MASRQAVRGIDLAEEVTSRAEPFVRLWDRADDWTVPRIPPSQLKVLSLLRHHGATNLTGLAQSLGAIPSSASRLCDRLEAAGLLSRSVPPDNRREVTIDLTREGRRRLEAFDATRHRDLSVVLDHMRPESRLALLEGLTAFGEAVTTMTERDNLAQGA